VKGCLHWMSAYKKSTALSWASKKKAGPVKRCYKCNMWVVER
jgi:hypothetical protein